VYTAARRQVPGRQISVLLVASWAEACTTVPSLRTYTISYRPVTRSPFVPFSRTSVTLPRWTNFSK
jgi:hypothetical protein